MRDSGDILCFGCGRNVGDPLAFEEEDEEPCATCRDRALAAAPSLLPSRRPARGMPARSVLPSVEPGEDALPPQRG